MNRDRCPRPPLGQRPLENDMTATHADLEKGINDAVETLGRLAYEPGKLTPEEAWALGVLTGSAQRLLRELAQAEEKKYPRWWEIEKMRAELAQHRINKEAAARMTDLERCLEKAVRDAELAATQRTFLPTGWEEEARKLLSER
jgi:hypothetical protein